MAAFGGIDDWDHEAESSDNFWRRFKEAQTGISEDLARVEREPPTDPQEQLDALRSRTQSIESSIAAATVYLPAYDVKRAMREVNELSTQIDAAKGRLVPRKKFAFGSRQKKTPEQSAATQTTPASASASTAAADIARPTPGAPAPMSAPPVLAQAGFRGRANCALTCATGSVPSVDGRAPDFHLQELDGCAVALCDNFGALRLEELTNCTVLCGPVSGSVYVDKCQGCTIFVAARQIRIHRSVSCDFCVCTASGPIIEDCSSMRFAPFTFHYPALDAHLAAANLALASDAWSDVKDFKWHRAQHSPNWSLLPVDSALKTLPALLEPSAGALGIALTARGAADEDEL